MRQVAAIVVILLLASLGLASAPYTLNGDGYWYGADGQRYTRTATQVWTAGAYYYRGCCRYQYPGYYTTSYSYTLVPLTYKSPDWKGQMLRMVEAREENDRFMQAAREFGFTRGLSQDYHSAASVVSGNTQYSVFKNVSATDVYGVDVNYLLQQRTQLQRDSMVYQDKGDERLAGLVDRAGERGAFIAEYLAKAQAASQVLGSIQPAASSHTRTSQTRVVPLAQLSNRRQAAIAACAQCHEGANAKGGYIASQHWLMTPEEQMEVVRSHLLADENSEGFMPKGGRRLPADLILEFVPAAQRLGIK